MQKKVNEAVVKLSAVEMNHHQAVMYYNIYMLTSVYFGSGIIELSEEQEKEIMKMTEPALLRKLGLSINFPRTVMYEAHNILGLGFMKPRIMIAAYMIKMPLGNMSLETNTSVLIQSLKEYDVVESGIENEIVKRNLKPYWTMTWINKFQEECIKQKIVIVNEKTEEVKVTKNKSLMEHAVQYVEERWCG